MSIFHSFLLVHQRVHDLTSNEPAKRTRKKCFQQTFARSREKTSPVMLLGVQAANIETIRNLSGWWYTYPSEKYYIVSWDYYSQYMEK